MCGLLLYEDAMRTRYETGTITVGRSGWNITNKTIANRTL